MVVDLPMSTGTLEEGTVVGGGSHPRYRVGRLLRRAETALLYALEDEFDRRLILKVYRSEATQGQSSEHQWQRERQLLRLARHPQVLPLLDAFRCGGFRCLVLERADTDLIAWVHDQGPLAARQVRELARQLLAGLHAIHAAGIIHLDLLPPNVLVRSPLTSTCSPQFLIADFGIGVRLIEASRLHRPPDQWAHVPPELLSPQPRLASFRCDLYNLGITLLHALLGGTPVSNDQPLDELESLVKAGVMAGAAEKVAPPLGPFLVALLQVDPERRPATALDAWRLLLSLEQAQA